MEGSTGLMTGTDGMSASELSSQSVPSNDTASESNSSNERLYKSNEVTDIVKRAKNDAIESVKRLYKEQPEYARQKYGDLGGQVQTQTQQPVQNSSTDSGEDRIRKLVAEETQRARDSWTQDNLRKTQEEQAQRVVNTFLSKINAGKEKYQDFDSVVSDIEFERYPNTVQLLADYIDNSADMLYELGKDRFKMAQLENLAQMSPNDAIKEARRLSESIKHNRASSNVKVPNEPLSQMQPSSHGLKSNGDMPTVADFKAMFRC